MEKCSISNVVAVAESLLVAGVCRNTLESSNTRTPNIYNCRFEEPERFTSGSALDAFQGCCFRNCPGEHRRLRGGAEAGRVGGEPHMGAAGHVAPFAHVGFWWSVQKS